MARLLPLSLSLPLALLLALAAPAGTQEVRDILGATHAAGRYSLTDQDFLNEGADRLLELGTRVIKVWFRLDAHQAYPFHSDWSPPAADLVELAQKPYYRALFDKPFTTYFLVVQPVTVQSQFLDGMTPEEVAAESEHLYRLARYLLGAYAGTGKTFVLQNWEGDHLLRQGLAPGEDPGPVRLQGMRDWWNARQEGVERARREARAPGVTVAHAAEVNLLAQALEGRVTAVNDVVPFTRADLYSYSSWDLGFDRTRLVRALDHLEARAPDSGLFGSRNVYLGELGAVRDQLGEGVSVRNVIHGLTETALAWGARWVLYWQLYCNETARPQDGRPGADDLRGFWLIRPDGSRAPVWEDFQKRLPGSLVRAALAGATGQLLAAEPGGDDAVRADRWRHGPWTAWTITDLDGGGLEDGDAVFLQARNGLFLTAAGDSVYARSVEAGPAETFTVRRLGPDGAVAFRTASGRYLAADPVRGGEVRAGGAAPGTWETFRLLPDWQQTSAPMLPIPPPMLRPSSASQHFPASMSPIRSAMPPLSPAGSLDSQEMLQRPGDPQHLPEER